MFNDQFIVHDGNRLALNLAEVVAMNPGDVFTNPLTIYGPPGCGKTTLLMEMKDAFIGKKVKYLTAREYLDLVSQAIKTDGPPRTALEESIMKLREFRSAFGCGIEVLLLDGMELFYEFQSTAFELAVITERMIRQGVQIVFAFDRNPEAVLPPLEEIAHPLVSLLKSGCIVEIWDPTGKKGG